MIEGRIKRVGSPSVAAVVILQCCCLLQMVKTLRNIKLSPQDIGQAPFLPALSK